MMRYRLLNMVAALLLMFCVEPVAPFVTMSRSFLPCRHQHHFVFSSTRHDDSHDRFHGWTTAQLLQALDDRSIRYGPGSTRRDLEFLLADAMDGQNHNKERSYRRRRERKDPDVVEQVLKPVAAVSSEILNAGFRQARRWKRHVSDAWAVDPHTGVRTVRYSKQPTTRRRKQSAPKRRVAKPTSGGTIDVPAKENSSSSSRPTRTRRPRNPTPRDAGDASRPVSTSPSRRPSPPPLHHQNISTAIVLASNTTLHHRQASTTPPPSTTRQPQQPPRRRRRPRRQQDPSKRIYSPYGESAYSPSVTAWMSQAADRVWGGGGDENGHWKDQWEERFDKLLGLDHNDEGDNSSYQRWTAKEKKRVETAAPRQHRRKRPSAPPHWVSLITGRHEDGSDKNFSIDHLLEDVWETGSVLSVCKFVFWTAARYYGQACRWATVRGALPQPAVALFVTAVAISVRQRRILWTVLTLLGVRAVGEAVSEQQSPRRLRRDHVEYDDDETTVVSSGVSSITDDEEPSATDGENPPTPDDSVDGVGI